MNIKTSFLKMSSDLHTPVSLYASLRSLYPEVLLLESSDYSSKEDSLSFICCDALKGFEVWNHSITYRDYVAGTVKTSSFSDLVSEVEGFMSGFNIYSEGPPKSYNGIFGFSSFDAVKYFDKNLYNTSKPGHNIPDMKYSLYRFIVVIDHMSEVMMVMENLPEGMEAKLDEFVHLLLKKDVQLFDFHLDDSYSENMSDQEFRDIVTECKRQCQRGDVFQIVPSRSFNVGFSGDDFNVYRKLRSINPSPYLFYFDYGSYRIFGSSPEAQMIVKDGIAEIHPIAGTVRRSGDTAIDLERAEALLQNPKENAEHIMLVDLARNDLSKNTLKVEVAKYREVQQFSHVIHLVSKVKGKLKPGKSSFQVFADTFPAGTLSGAPKYKAIQLIDELEPTKRGFYGGGIGIINFNGNLNHAIIIRSVLSIDNRIYLQAGAGIVIDSTEEGELQEVNNKVAAVRMAIEKAQELNKSPKRILQITQP